MRKNAVIFIYATIFLLFLLSLFHLGFFHIDQPVKAMSNLAKFIRDALPPDFKSLSGIGISLLETVEMAFAGTVFGFVISFPLAVLGTRILFPSFVVAMARFIAGLLRTVPPLLWAVLFVIIVGLGPLAGTLSLAFYTVGYLTKLYSELFEGTDPEVLEAVKGAGATTPYLIRYVVLPEGANAIVSQFLFMFEYNIRASSILGFVGAGGIGFQIYVHLQTMEYQKLTAVLILIFAIVLLMDFAGALVRRRYLLRAAKI